MFALLAQTASTPDPSTPAASPPPESHSFGNLFDAVVQIFSSVDTLAKPDELVKHLQTLSVVWAVVFIVVGLLCMLSGARHYKAVVITLAFLVGMFVGYCLGQRIDAPYIVAACLGVLLAVASYPLMKYAVAAFGALTGAFVGANLWVGLAHALQKSGDASMPPDGYWIGALIGLIVCGMLAFILFKFSVVMFTSVSGATVAVLGVLCLLLSFQPWQSGIVRGVTASQLIVPLLVFVPAVIALILQQSWTPEIAAANGPGAASKKS